jgi:F1F0 ATPase subunit 2
MSEVTGVALAVVTGMMLGAIFFGGLWWTVINGIKAREPARWFICSWLLRTGIVVSGFYLLLGLPGASWAVLLAGLAGFGLVRLVATRLLSVPAPTVESGT